MKRIERDPAKFEVLRLFASLGRQEGFILGDEQSEKKFLERISASLVRYKENTALLHGLRAEDLFQYVVASLGKCLLIKQEDRGEPLASNKDIQPPDYFLVLHDKSRFLVEVKSCNKKYPPCRFSLKKSYVDNLQEYADLIGSELKIAVYWSAWNLWTLVCPSHLKYSKGKCSITIGRAMETNQMETVGDYTVGTRPPLILRIIADKKKSRSIGKDGTGQFTIGEIKLLCANKIITDKIEKGYAFYFMLYGDWCSNEPLANIEDNKLVSIDHIIEPTERTPGQEFELLGFMSSMISRRYRQLLSTSLDGEKLAIALEPDALSINIRKGYKGKALPLWRFHLRPNLRKVDKKRS